MPPILPVFVGKHGGSRSREFVETPSNGFRDGLSPAPA